MLPALAAEYFGRIRLASTLGMIMGIVSIGGMIWPPFMGLIFDKFGSYQISLFGCTGVIIVGIISLMTAPEVSSKRT